MWFVYASRFNKPDLQTNFSIKFFTYLLISLKLVKELFFVSFERLLRCPPLSVGHYHKVTPSLFGRPPRIHLKINQRTLCAITADATLYISKRLMEEVVHRNYTQNIYERVCQSQTPKRRCSSHTFRYGYLVTT